MKKLIALILFVAVISIAQAETPEEGRKLHPKANIFYCKKKTYKENQIPPMSSIERIAWDEFDIYIKYYNQENELHTKLDGKIQNIGDWHYLPLVIGGIGLNIQAEKLAFFNLSKEIEEVFDLDISKTYKSSELREY